YPCTSAQVASGTYTIPLTVANGANDKLDCVSASSTCPSNWNTIKPSIIPICTDSSTVIGTTVSQRSDNVTLKANVSFVIAFQDQAWADLNGPGSGAVNTGATWSISTWINLIPRSDTGLYNNPPVSTMMSPITIVRGVKQTIQIPIADPEDDVVRCRWANSTNECADV
ncbi:unnamed protein product, partial [Didymodactylos carnosus]